ncbi:radical SAM family heme chaperone HemW [Tunicatimonas pelagia]|uniref:radical SAM family heme chaperone HemW n=1 Tax=Tunicatimonas pelagia TaxID=931531 RepID=UPI002665F671|nr:radical SAM family heme chaperone HemW [Tunicatimonas pelagia]WKN46198.1 radical SAM family heme chaperone HemW [Tunicatimonas pelagia]
MAGIYIHIPFCKQACHYCDFHFSTNQQRKTDMVRAIARELELQQPYLTEQIITSIYFGGGTPSLLDEAELQMLLNTVYKLYPISSDPEITLEANPDDLSPEKLKILKQLGFNRLSIGIQSFHEPHLRYLNRVHSAKEAEQCVQQAQEAGFNNLSIDLIYAVPHPDHSVWQADLANVVALNPEHISAYCLTIEEKTVFGQWLRHQKIPPIDETFAAEQFGQLVDTLTANGYEQYEVSSFCQPSWESKHNSNYWKDVRYLGVGPGAHSFNGNSRQYNVANNGKYLRALAKDQVPYEQEELNKADRINEYLMTGLRTKWGCDLAWLKQKLDYDLLATQGSYIEHLIHEKKATLENQQLVLTRAGKLLADGITAALFVGSE